VNDALLILQPPLAMNAGERLQNQQGVIHVLVSRLENQNEAINGLRSSSRDFH
jgi:hypothetical protein